ncbi:hypothetical protein CTEN210_00575 [Chaetoceros tenuissimus]|uniref:Uncharacterized protein n=1 Tax=Chaetoceros tenuissimus TaxID=426638 RepID=A0AAD3GYU4_9STRA|nr:hypothetical protein CTEN210_00575 [Chaetoceros tenuissimus]
MNSPLYALPDEVLQKCIAFIGEGHYALVATVSKKVYNAHEEEYGIDKSYTTYEIATVSVETVKYCNEEFCNRLHEKDRLFTAAAVNGNIDILRYSVESGYDLFPFIHVHVHDDSEDSDSDSYNDDDDEDKHEIVGTGNIAAKGNLNVLKYLKDQFESCTWLQKYCQPAIKHGQLEILKWLDSIGCLSETDIFGTKNDFCLLAISSGQLDVLKWLYSLGFKESERSIHYAIESKSIEMIQYCLDRGHEALRNEHTNTAVTKARSIELYRFFHSLGYRFTMSAFHGIT